MIQMITTTEYKMKSNYINLKPNNYEGETELITLELPTYQIDGIMHLCRPIAEQKNTNAERILKDLIKDCAYQISESNKSYERKSRKNAKR